MRQFQEAVVSLVRSVYPGCLVSRRNWLPSRQCVATGWVLHVSLCSGQEKVLLLRLLRCSGQVSINTSSLASKHHRRGQSGLAVSPYIPHSQQVTSSENFIHTWVFPTQMTRLPLRHACLSPFKEPWIRFVSWFCPTKLSHRNSSPNSFWVSSNTFKDSTHQVGPCRWRFSDLFREGILFFVASVSLTRCYPECLAHCDETVLNLLSLKSFP